jgi:DNA polymerase-3 subunit epsilon
MTVDPLTFISIDTETTGLSFKDDRIIQFGAAVFIRGKMVHRENIYIKTSVPNGGFAVNKISDEQIAAGTEPSSAFHTIRGLFGQGATNRICIYNAPFDLSFLAHEFVRHGIPYDFNGLQILDPLVMARYFHKFQKCRLTDMCQRYGIPLPDAHDAAADSEAAGHVYLAMRANYATLHPLYMNKDLARWHRVWSISFNEWYYNKYGTFPEIEPWPIRPEWMESSCSHQSELF